LLSKHAWNLTEWWFNQASNLLNYKIRGLSVMLAG
jgi:hypothetical protein